MDSKNERMTFTDRRSLAKDRQRSHPRLSNTIKPASKLTWQTPIHGKEETDAHQGNKLLVTQTKTHGIITNAYDQHYCDKYMKDAFGQTMTEWRCDDHVRALLMDKQCWSDDWQSLLREHGHDHKAMVSAFDIHKKTMGSDATKANDQRMLHKAWQCLVDHQSMIEYRRVPKINPSYRVEEYYVPRAQRAEWIPVATRGCMMVWASIDVQPGRHVDCVNGRLVPALQPNPRLLVLSATNSQGLAKVKLLY